MIVLIAADVSPGAVVKPDAVTQAQVSQTYGKLPLSFEANQGLTDAQVKFLSRGNGYTLFLTLSEAVLALSQPATPTMADAEDTQTTEYGVLRMQLVVANPEPDVAGLEELPGKSNYVVAPGADPTAIRLRFEGADQLRLDTQGNLVMTMAGGEGILNAPIIYQEFNGVRQSVPGSYMLQGKFQVGFQLSAYDARRTLVIDPVLVY